MNTHPPVRVEFEAIPRNKVYQEVAKQLERRIAEQMRPGDLLPPERELVQMLGVSRGSVRDAIRSLELMGLLEPRQGIGTVVRDPLSAPANSLTAALLERHRTVEELLDVRKMIEPPLAGRAALHASPKELDDMQQILIRQEEKVQRSELATDEDSEFHYAIALASDNSVVLKVVDVLMDLLKETTGTVVAGGRTAGTIAGRPSPNSCGLEAGRRKSRGGGHAPTLAGNRKDRFTKAVKRMEVAKWASYSRLR